MSGKSRRGKGRSPLQSKKKKSNRNINQIAVARPQAVTGTKTITRSDEPAVVSAEAMVETAAPAAAVDTMPAGIDYPNLPFELRRIGILAGIMLAALVLLVLILG